MIVVIPGRKEMQTMRMLVMRGYALTTIRGRGRQLTTAQYIPVLTNVVPLHKRPAHRVLEWLRDG